jgi:hypothetical protein
MFEFWSCASPLYPTPYKTQGEHAANEEIMRKVINRALLLLFNP